MARKLRLLLPVALLIVAVVLGFRFCHRQGTVMAQVGVVSGQVTVTQADGTQVPAALNMTLFAGQVVTTGAEGHITLFFPGGNRIELGPNARLSIGPIAGSQARFGAVILSGSAHVIGGGGGNGTRLAIGGPFGFTEVSGRQAIFEIGLEEGFSVTVGAIDVILPDGSRRPVQAGERLNLAGIVLAIRQAPTLLLREPMSLALRASARGAEVQADAKQDWQAQQGNTPVHQSDSLRTLANGQADVDISNGGTVHLGPNALVKFTEAGKNAERSIVAYTVSQGPMSVSLGATVAGAPPKQHLVTVAGSTLALKPGPLIAGLGIEAGADGAMVSLRHGSLTLPGNQSMEAGSRAELVNGALVGSIVPLSDYVVDVRARSTAIVYYLHRRSPAIRFTWPPLPDRPSLIEIASDRDFAHLVAAERVSQGSLILDDLEPGRYVWRVDGDQNSISNLTIMPEPKNFCASCSSQNNVVDTGEKTLVYFQQTVPAISFNWKAVDAAHDYVLRLFIDRDFDRAKFEHVTQKPQYNLQAGELNEGSYFWLVVSRDAKGRELATGRINPLRIAYDNAVVAMAIRAPAENALISARRVRTNGAVEGGLRLELNDRPLQVDENGRFEANISLNSGANTLVYRALTEDGTEHICARRVRRRP